jgi:peptidoglycan-associated lipoprotein
MSPNRFGISAAVMLGALTLAVGCKPTYPKCNNTDDCNSDGHKGVCIDGTCQECGADKDCQAGFICRSNKCTPKPECQSDGECTAPKICRNEKCVLECEKDGDCGAGQTCKSNRCAMKPECTTDTDCGGNKKCVDNSCQAPAGCNLDTIHFAYNESTLDDDSKSTLQKNADCIKSKTGGGRVTIAGNCDDRGTEEYNLHLGQRRADSAMKYLLNLGLSKKQLKTISYGKDKPTCSEASESCWGQNRRDDFTQE